MLAPAPSITEQFQQVRKQTLALTRNLSAEDMTAQSMPDASPVKWHLAHTTWFFETFILREYLPNYRLFDDAFPHLFNSYYVSAGSRYLRASRGLLTRPSLEQVLAYRHYVDEHMLGLLEHEDANHAGLTTIGLHHEMQHQELLLTDVLHLLAHNPIFPAVFESRKESYSPVELAFKNIEGSMIKVGAREEGFSYDCERPCHLTYLSPHQLANRLVTNQEWLEFMTEGGYDEPLLWLSDGWACKEKNNWQSPLYWEHRDDQWFQYGLDGLQVLDMKAPVSHVSYYEADAFARWAGKRLPREAELEYSAQLLDIQGNFVESEIFRPQAAKEEFGELDVFQLYGDVWEWTQSAYLPYPKFKAEQGALGEYNGKFMANQFVLKGGSCATPRLQMRPSYRNFFYPHHRWQFSGLRLADDI